MNQVELIITNQDVEVHREVMGEKAAQELIVGTLVALIPDHVPDLDTAKTQAQEIWHNVANGQTIEIENPGYGTKMCFQLKRSKREIAAAVNAANAIRH